MGKAFAPAVASLTLVSLLALGSAARADGLDVKVASITSPVPPGGSVTMVIATAPGATCHGTRQVHAGNEIRLQPLSLTAGADGTVRWAWRVLPGMHPVGKRTAHVECTLGDRSGAVDTVFDVRF